MAASPHSGHYPLERTLLYRACDTNLTFQGGGGGGGGGLWGGPEQLLAEKVSLSRPHRHGLQEERIASARLPQPFFSAFFFFRFSREVHLVWCRKLTSSAENTGEYGKGGRRRGAVCWLLPQQLPMNRSNHPLRDGRPVLIVQRCSHALLLYLRRNWVLILSRYCWGVGWPLFFTRDVRFVPSIFFDFFLLLNLYHHSYRLLNLINTTPLPSPSTAQGLLFPAGINSPHPSEAGRRNDSETRGRGAMRRASSCAVYHHTPPTVVLAHLPPSSAACTARTNSCRSSPFPSRRSVTFIATWLETGTCACGRMCVCVCERERER